MKIIHESDGENVALVQLVYDALSVTFCPDSTLPVFAVNVQLGPVGLVHVPLPVQSLLQCPAVPLSGPSSQTSFGLTDRVCHGRNVHACV